ncbi:MAG: GvpL/GvpF family gas vesicle protein [Mangrovibacterium sp.]
MQKDGKYIYCIIASDYDCNFGPIGIGGEKSPVTTIGFDGLCMVVSNHPLNKFVVNPENILAHQKVIEKVMTEFNSVIPVRFGTIAATPDEIRNLLQRRYSEFSELLRTFENRVEFNMKGRWKNMEVIYKEIDTENAEVQAIRGEVEQEQDPDLKKGKMAKAGEIVQKALEQKKEQETENILDSFRRIVFDHRENKTNEDPLFMNTAFLVNSGREKEIDNIMSDLGDQYKDRIDFIYTAPLPIFNFVDLKIFPEKWEV